jgi:hypothetical protein
MGEWFAPKRHGLGSGRPISWQGWVSLLVYLVVVIGATQLINRSPWAMGSVIVTATAIFIVIAAKTTRGGWRWRWGDNS